MAALMVKATGNLTDLVDDQILQMIERLELQDNQVEGRLPSLGTTKLLSSFVRSRK